MRKDHPYKILNVLKSVVFDKKKKERERIGKFGDVMFE